MHKTCTLQVRACVCVHAHGHVCAHAQTPRALAPLAVPLSAPCSLQRVLPKALLALLPQLGGAPTGQPACTLTRPATQAQGKGLRGPCWARQVQLPRDGWTCRGLRPSRASSC